MGLEMAGMMRKSWIVAGMAAVLLSNCALGTGNAPTTDGAVGEAGDGAGSEVSEVGADSTEA